MTDAIRPDSVEEPDDTDDGPSITEPTKIIRIASMTRALLEEARSAGLDDAGRATLMQIHDRSLSELRGVLSDDLLAEFDAIFEPIQSADPSESVVRIAQAQLIGWLEGLFHGIQASLASQQMAAQAQLQQMQQRRRLQAPDSQDEDRNTGLYR